MEGENVLDLYDAYYCINSNDQIINYQIQPITSDQLQYTELIQNLIKSNFKINQFNGQQYIELLYAIKQYFSDLFQQLLIQSVLQNMISLYELSHLKYYQPVLNTFYKINIEVNNFIKNLTPQQMQLIHSLIAIGLEQKYFNFSLLNIIVDDKSKIQQIFSQEKTIYLTKIDEIEFLFEHAQDVTQINYVYNINQYEMKQRKIKFMQTLSKLQSQNDINQLYLQLKILYDYQLKTENDLGLENIITQFFRKISQLFPFKELYKIAMEYIVEFSNIVNKQQVYQLMINKYIETNAEINTKYLERILLKAQKDNITVQNISFDSIITTCSDEFIQQYYEQILKGDCSFNTKCYIVLLKLSKNDIYKVITNQKIQQQLLQLTMQFNQYSKINDLIIFTKHNTEQLTASQYDRILQNLQCLYTYFSDNNLLSLTKNLTFMIQLIDILIKGAYFALQNSEYHNYIPYILVDNEIQQLLNNFDMSQTKKILFLIEYSSKQQQYYEQFIKCVIKMYNPIKTPQLLLQNDKILLYDNQNFLSQQKIDMTFLLMYLQQDETPDTLNSNQLEYLKNHIKYLFFRHSEFWKECSIKNYCYYLLLCYILQDRQLNFQVVKYFIQKIQLKNSRSQQSLINQINQGQHQAFLQRTEVKFSKQEIKQYFDQIQSSYEDKQCISLILSFEIANYQQASILRAL